MLLLLLLGLVVLIPLLLVLLVLGSLSSLSVGHGRRRLLGRGLAVRRRDGLAVRCGGGRRNDGWLPVGPSGWHLLAPVGWLRLRLWLRLRSRRLPVALLAVRLVLLIVAAAVATIGLLLRWHGALR